MGFLRRQQGGVSSKNALLLGRLLLFLMLTIATIVPPYGMSSLPRVAVAAAAAAGRRTTMTSTTSTPAFAVFTRSSRRRLRPRPSATAAGTASTRNSYRALTSGTTTTTSSTPMSFEQFYHRLRAIAQEEQEVDPGIVEGTDLRVLKYPHPSLRAHNDEVSVEELKDGTIAKIAKEMFLVMYAAQGVGLAAPQVGINKRFMVYNESGDKKKWLDEVILINPQIVDSSDSKTIETEGCLSFPDMSGDVERSKWIKVEALNLKGKKIKRKYVDWEARIFQHEYDHLDGIVYIDRLIPESQESVKQRLSELVEEYDPSLNGEPAL